jgi:hypothetical protein
MDANTSNSTSLTTNFNVTPYYDDYDPSSGYYRILFKPGYAVQARELTQMQTALQEQIARFGRNIFKDGTIVIPGQFTLETNEGRPAGRGISYVKVNDYDASNNSVSMNQWNTYINQGKANGNTRLEVVGATSNITAKVIQVLDGTQASTNTKTIYVAYTSSSSANASIKSFQVGETLTANINGTLKTLVVANTANATGKGSRFSISSGVLFAKNHFVAFPDQSIIINRYDANPTARVGFYITEDIVTASQDSTLLDPAQEASNYSAPGADRLALNPTLDVVPIDASPSVQDFVSLFTIENGIVKSYNANTQYSYINDAMARRTFDNSGDYVVNGLDVQLKEHDDTGSNYGRYPNGNNKLLYVGVSPGSAYVSGYQVGMPATMDLSTEKGLTTSNVTSQLAAANMGQYVTVNEFVGGWELNKGNSIGLYDTAQKRITGKGWSTAAQTGSQIGSAIILSVQYVSGTPGYDAKYNVYLADIKMTGSNTFDMVRSLYAAAVGGYNSAIGADAVLDPVKGLAVLQNVPQSTLLYFTGSNYTDTIRDSNDILSTHTMFEFNDTQGVSSGVQVSTNGIFTISISAGIEEFPYGTTTLQGISTSGIYATFNKTSGGATSMAVGLSGVTSTSSSNVILNGTGTHFTRLNVGDKIQLSGNTFVYQIKSIVNDTQLVVDQSLPSSNNGNTLTKIYEAGDQINLFGLGSSAGVQRTITTTSTSLRFNLQETFPSIFYATVTYPVARTTALEIKKTLRAGRYVKINPSSAGLTGPYDLGFSDVYKIKSIRKGSGSYPTSNTSGIDVTTSFILDNGQRDTHYDHATIKPKVLLTTNDRLLVELDYFAPDFTSGAGYFSIDSYPIQDNDTLFNPANNIRTENIPVFKSTITGQSYDLRNQLDFRPVKTNTSTDTTNPASASVNPSSSSSLTYPAAGMKLPVPSSVIEYDFYYYLGRTDIVAVDKDNRFQVLKGQPSSNPQTPVVPPGIMALSQLNITPYPSLSPAYATKLGRQELASTAKSIAVYRYTMRDIGSLKQRIVNLEYYTSLSLLEKAASGAVIQNEAGNDRFKNGIFTDSFRDNSNAADYDPEFRIVFDTKERSIRPVYKMESIVYNYLSGTNVKYQNPVITVDYTEILHHAQSYVTMDINVERQSWLFLGQVNLYPSQDIWVDTTIMPDEMLSRQSIYVVNYGTQGASNEAITAYGPTAHYDLNSGNSNYGIYQANGYFNQNTTGGVVDVLNTTNWDAWNTHVVGYKVYTGSVSSDGNPYSTTFTTYDAARSYAQSINPIGGAGVTIETVYNTVRTGTQYWEADSADVVQTDYKVIDVQNYSYIRPQTITVQCTGMKPYTRMWPYFDSVAMANSARPLTSDQFSWIIQNGQYGLAGNTLNDIRTGTSTNAAAGIVPLPSSLGPWANYGDTLITDSNGMLKFQMQITKGQFRVGQRNCLVIDSRNYIDLSSAASAADVPVDVSTGGGAVFTASGQAITKQRSILTTKTVSYHTEAVSQNYNSAGFEYIAAPPPPAPASHSCTAYSFLSSAPNGEEGIFLTSVDIFVSRIGREGFWCEIREMDSGQQITRNTVPYSEVFFNNPASVPISPNGKGTPCNVKFDIPIFLYNNTQYAFIIHPINANPDLYVWCSRLGEMDINGLGTLHDRRGTGTFYQTNNNTNWDIIEGVDLTCKFYRAEFNKNQASATIGNRPIEKLYVYNNTINFANSRGHIFISGDHIALPALNSGASVAVTDFVVGDRSFQNSAAVNVATGVAGVIAAANTGYYIGEIIRIYSSNGTFKGQATNSGITNGQGTLDYYIDGPTSLVQFTGSGGGFVVGDYIIDSTDWSQYGYLTTIWSIGNWRYSAFHFEPSALNFQLTNMTYEMTSVDTTGTNAIVTKIDPSTTQYFNKERAVLSRTNEINVLGGTNSQTISVNMKTSSNSVSPLLDLTKTQTIIIDNIINNDTTDETLPTHGALINKYISKTVTLAEGQDAEDIRVILSAYRPPGTDVKVWIKVKCVQDPTPFEQIHWVELYKDGTGDQTYSSLDDRNNFKEYTYLVPTSSVDRVTIANTKGFSTGVNVGFTLNGLTSGFSAMVENIEGGTIYVMSDSGYYAGETANVVNTTGSVVGNTQIYATGRTVALNGDYGGAANVITYTTDAGVTYSTYKYFSIKVGLLNDGVNSAVVPRVGDLRAIALQM